MTKKLFLSYNLTLLNQLSGMPEQTQEVVELYDFLQESRDSTLFTLKNKLLGCMEFMNFLIQHQAIFPDEDIKLNTRAINWPRDMEGFMDLAAARLQMRKEFVEGILRNRRVAFDENSKQLQIKINHFKKKDPPILSLEEMTAAVQEIDLISAGLLISTKMI